MTQTPRVRARCSSTATQICAKSSRPGMTVPAGTPFCRASPGGYGFFPQERVRVDADEFAKQVKLAESSRLSQKRSHLHDLYFRSAARYAAMERKSGNPGEARRVLEDALFRDPGNTEYLRLMLAVLQQMKLRTEAREWTVRHAEFMKKELPADVDPEVSAIIAG